MGIQNISEFTDIGQRHMLRIRQFPRRQNPDKLFLPVSFFKSFCDGLHAARRRRIHHKGRIDSPVDRDQVRNEVHRQIRHSCCQGKFLFNFREMSMPCRSIGSNALIAFRENIRQIHLAPRAGDAAQTRHNDFPPEKQALHEAAQSPGE